MVKIQIDLTEEENKITDIYKAEGSLETKEEAIKEMIRTFSKCKHKFEVFEKRKFKRYDVIGSTEYAKVIQKCSICGNFRTDVLQL